MKFKCYFVVQYSKKSKLPQSSLLNMLKIKNPYVFALMCFMGFLADEMTGNVSVALVAMVRTLVYIVRTLVAMVSTLD